MSSLIKDIFFYAMFVLILFLFYRSLWAMILLVPLTIVYRRISKKERLKKYNSILSLQFKDALISIAAALRAGYSLENSLEEAYGEMNQVYGNQSPICKELRKTINEIKLAVPAETAFDNFAKRTGVEDIKTFSQVFRIAKRTGGDLVEIIMKTSADISTKVETRNEIDILVSSKKFENMIMMVMPIGIILYMTISSSGMLDPLYGNITGVLIMTGCLIIYAAAVLISRKILNIEV